MEFQRLHSLIKPVLWLIVCSLLVVLTFKMPSYISRRQGEFVAYLVSSKVIAAGQGAAHFYEDDLFRSAIAELGYEGTAIFYPNPPTTALLFLPFSKIDFRSARFAWVMLSVIFLGLSAILQFRTLELSSPWNLAAISIMLASQPLRADLHHGQVYTLVLFLTTLVWVSLRRNNQIVAGIAYVGMLSTKLFALPLGLFLILRRFWKTIGVSVLALLMIVLFSLPILTLSSWLAFFRVFQRMANDPTLSVTAFQSLQSFIRHVFIDHPVWNPEPIWDLPLVASVLLWSSQLLFIGITLYTVYISKNIDLAFAAVIAMSIFLSPFAQDYTYVVLLLPITILLSYLRDANSIQAGLIGAIGVLLVVLNFPIKSPQLATGYWVVLAYPKLYGALLIWGLLIWLVVSRHGKRKINVAAPKT